MFSNRQPQKNSTNLLHQSLPPPPPAISINSVSESCNNNLIITSVAISALDNLNCGGIPTRTTPTLTPTTLRTIAADIIGLPGPTDNFAVAAASDLHHLVSSSCPVIVPSSGTNEIQDRQNLQNLGNQHLNLQNLNNQHLSVQNLQNHQLINDDNLNQQHNDYKNSFRQAGFVPPLVLQINSNNAIQQSSSLTVLVNSSNNSNSNYTFSEKDSSNIVSTSHWQGAVVTENPQRSTRNTTKRQFSDEDDDFDSPEDGSDSSETCSVKASNKKNTKSNKSNSKINKGTTNSGRQKNNRIMSNEEEERRQIRRERNKLAAARCRKRRMDHTNELLEETEQLEDKRLRLQVEIQSLRQQKTDLQQMLAQHRCVININHLPVSNAISNINNTLVDSTIIPKHEAIMLNDSLSTNKVNTIQENINENVKNNIDSIDNIIIKCEDQLVNDHKDDIHLIPTTVLHQSVKRKPNSLLQLNFRNNKKISESDSNGVVLLNFDSLMDGGSGLTPVCGNLQNQIQHDSSETKQ